jgi:DNA repair exonuclease SbcCD ATPase subunit
MNKIVLKGFKFKAFRSFIKEQEISDLPENGLIQIRGASGFGKSNLHMVLGYLWGYAPYPDTELQSFLTDNRVQAELHFQFNGQDGVLKRGKEEFSFNNLKGSVKLVETAIQKFLKIPVTLLEPLTVRHQRDKSPFLSMPDSKKKEFLSKLLGLEEIEENIKESIKGISLLEKEIYEQKMKIDHLKLILVEPNKPVKEDIDGKVKESDSLKRQLVDLSENISILSNNLEGLENNKKEYLNYWNKQINNELFDTDNLQKQLNIINKNIEELDNISKTSANELQRYSHKMTQTQDLEHQLLSLQSRFCPYCGQKWLNFKSKMEEVNVKLSEIEDCKLKCIDTEQLYKKTLNEINDLKVQRESLLTQIQDKNENMRDRFLTETTKTRLEFDQKIQNAKRQKDELLDKYSILDKNNKQFLYEIALSNGKHKLLTDEYNKNYNKYLEIKQLLDKTNSDFLSKSLKYKEEVDFVSLCKGFLGFIFEEVLDEISLEANNILKQIRNVSAVSVRFDTEKINKNDTIRQEIKLVLNQNGHELPSFRTLSGGQQEAVELAIDLSLGNVISRRTGVFPGWLVLDEPFSGLGIEEKESCLEMLKIAACDRLIFVIDHSTESKEMFDQFIDVTNHNGESNCLLTKI